MSKEDMLNKISFALKDPILQMGFEVICSKLARLEKENAELKNRNSELAGQKAILERWYGEAKELIGELISSLSVVGECELLNRAEQFIKE